MTAAPTKTRTTAAPAAMARQRPARSGSGWGGDGGRGSLAGGTSAATGSPPVRVVEPSRAAVNRAPHRGQVTAAGNSFTTCRARPQAGQGHLRAGMVQRLLGGSAGLPERGAAV